MIRSDSKQVDCLRGNSRVVPSPRFLQARIEVLAYRTSCSCCMFSSWGLDLGQLIL